MACAWLSIFCILIDPLDKVHIHLLYFIWDLKRFKRDVLASFDKYIYLDPSMKRGERNAPF